MVVGAMTSHGEVVTSCKEITAARPWLVSASHICLHCSDVGRTDTLSHLCTFERHVKKWTTTAALAACAVGDLDLLRRLMAEHPECDAAVRTATMRDKVSTLRARVALWCCGSDEVCEWLSQDGDTGLLLACWRGHLLVAQWLVGEAGSDATSEQTRVMTSAAVHRPRGRVSEVARLYPRRTATRPSCWRVLAVAWTWRDGSFLRLAVTQDRSETR
jgi:hypothetical protein